MQRPQHKFRVADRRVVWNWTTIILAVHAIIFLTLVGLAVGYPGASEWISAAVQSEFVNAQPPAAAPTQIAHPAEPIQTVISDWLPPGSAKQACNTAQKDSPRRVRHRSVRDLLPKRFVRVPAH